MGNPRLKWALLNASPSGISRKMMTGYSKEIFNHQPFLVAHPSTLKRKGDKTVNPN
jgi:hypothetical protein